MDFPISYEENRIVNIFVTNIFPSPFQPRTSFDLPSLKELASSIKTYGFISPITVRVINGHTYELVTGERRWRAAKIAGLELIPAVIINVSDADAAAIALAKNVHRQSLHFFEEAMGYFNLIKDYDLSLAALSEKIGKSEVAITQKLKLVAVPEKVRKIVVENGLTEQHCLSLLKVPSKSVMEELAHRAVNEKLSVKQLDSAVEDTLKTLCEIGGEAAVRKKFGDVRIINNTAKKAVEIMKKSGVEADYDVCQTEDSFKIVVTIPYK